MAGNRVDRTIESIKKALDDMLDSLNDELDRVVSGGAFDKTKVDDILAQVDAVIIKNPNVQNILLNGSEENQKKITERIESIQVQVKAKIEEFRDKSTGAVLSDSDYKEVMESFETKVEKSDSVTRTTTLKDFRKQAKGITFETAREKVTGVDAELEIVTQQLATIELLEKKQKPGETPTQTAQRLAKEAENFKFKGGMLKTVEKINGSSAYDYKSAQSKLAVVGFSYKEQGNQALTAEFLTELAKLKENNPEIQNLFTELLAVGIKFKDGVVDKSVISKLNRSQRAALQQKLNARLIKNPINFDDAKVATTNAIFDRIDAEMERVIKSDFMQLYPDKVEDWKKRLEGASIETKKTVYEEMQGMFKDPNRDLPAEIESLGLDLEDKSTLTAQKATLEVRLANLTNRHNGERFEKVDGKTTQIELDLSGKKAVVATTSLEGLSAEDKQKAIDTIYIDNKKSFSKDFNANAPATKRNPSIWSRFIYAIQHFTIHPKAKMIEEYKKEYAQSKIEAAMHKAELETAKLVGARDEAYRTGALTPDQLAEVRAKQAEVLAKHKAKQEEEILRGTTTDAKTAADKVKNDTEAEIGE